MAGAVRTLFSRRLIFRVSASFLAVAMLTAMSPVSVSADDDDNGRLRDNFRGDAVGTPLPEHAPDEDPVGDGWVQSIGADFRINADGRSVRDAGLNLSPKIAYIDTLVSEFDLAVTITRAGPGTLTGVVFRYVDAENYMAAVHDGKQLRLIKVVTGVQAELDRKSFKSEAGAGDLWELKVRETSIAVEVNGKRKLKSSDTSFAGATIAGLIQQPSHETSFSNFVVKSDGNGDHDDGEDDGHGATDAPSAPVVLDSFSAPDGTALDLHTSTEVTSGGHWSETVGEWEITDGRLTLASPDPVHPSADHFAVIPTEGAPLQEISADVTWHGGFAGLTWNVVDKDRYSLVFWDGKFIVVGRVENGVFLERGRRLASWSPGQTRNLRIQLFDDNAFVYLDASEPILLAFGIEQPTVLNAGVFDRFNAGNSFDNFTVRQSPAAPELPVLVPDPPIGPPTPVESPEDAWLFDSFNSSDFSLLRFRTPEVDPSGNGWTDEDGLWMLLQQQASEQSGVLGELGFDRFAVIDTGADEYELKSKLTWDGGRAGVFFGGRGTGPDDAGRNGFIFFRSGDFLHVGRLIGGVYFKIGTTDDFKWKAGKSRTIEVEVESGKARLRLNGDTIFSFEDAALEGSTWAGLFQRGGQDERYEDFTVRLP